MNRVSRREFDRGSERPRRGDRDRGRQDAVRDRFAPRGHRHTAAEESIDINASAEPFILPGESLSKYRRDEDAEKGSRISRNRRDTQRREALD